MKLVYIAVLVILILIVMDKIAFEKFKEKKLKELEDEHKRNMTNKLDITDLPDNDNMPLDGEFLVAKYIVYRGCHIKLLNNGHTYITFPLELHRLLYAKGEQYRSKYPVRLCRQADISTVKCWYFVSDRFTMSEIIRHSKYIVDDIYLAKEKMDEIVDAAVKEILE